MSNLIRKIIKHTKNLTNWKFLIKNNFNLASVMCKNNDLQLEELRLENNVLQARSKTLVQKQRSIESMITDMTRTIKQMEFDIEPKKMPTNNSNNTDNKPPTVMASPLSERSDERGQQEKSQQKI